MTANTRYRKVIIALEKIREHRKTFAARDLSKMLDMTPTTIGNILRFIRGVEYVSYPQGWRFTGERLEVSV